MPSRRTPFSFVDLQGRPLGDQRELLETAGQAAKRQREQDSAAALGPADLERVFDALVLAGWRRGKSALAALLRALEWTRERGGFFDGADVGAALRELARQGRVQAHSAQQPQFGQGWSVPDALAEARLPALLARPEDAARAWRAWAAAAGTYPAHAASRDAQPEHVMPRDGAESAALLRLLFASRVPAAEYAQLTHGPLRLLTAAGPMLAALAQTLRLGFLDRIAPVVLWQLLGSLERLGQLWREPALRGWAEAHLGEAPAGLGAELRLSVAEWRLQRGDIAGIAPAIGQEPAALPFLPLLLALAPAREGRFADTVAAYPSAWKALTAALGQRRGFAPMSLLQWIPLALMAQPEAAAWTVARKFCVAMSGSRTPSSREPWGLWAHALAVRLGDERLEPDAFAPRVRSHDPSDADRRADPILLAAWLGHARGDWLPATVQGTSDDLHAQGLPWKADLVAQACVHLGWPVPARPPGAPPAWPVAFFKPRQDAWREALAAITALGGVAGARGERADAPPATLLWRLTLDAAGRVHDLQAFEPAATARGKPKPLTPLQLKKRARLDPRDGAVARALRSSPFRVNDVSLDLVQAALALQGHPAVHFADTPGVAVELSEGLPVLEVKRERAADGSERFVFHLADALLPHDEPELEHHFSPLVDEEVEIDRRNSLVVLRDSPERARLVRVTAAHRRVAELVAQRWAVPASATAELDAALRVLAGHFLLHSDAAAGEPVQADARLVARLEPRGGDLRLTLAVRPFGEHGPLLVPGQGRARLMTLRAGISLATERQLDTERAHFAAVLEGLPFLGASPEEAPPEAVWLLDDPEQALAAVHRLGRLAGDGTALRALEWPQGKPIRVVEPEAKAFTTQLATGRDWFAVSGELRLDEGRVLSLGRLLTLLAEARGSRYVALGEGQYLRLADRLRQRLSELQALAEADGERLKMGSTGSAWLADAADDIGLEGDAGWRRRAAELERAGALDPDPPPGLQAELRPYQRDGYAWMRRLAAAGFGAVLADDMGLGKTVQTLALLLARADDGAALVVAPTSVCDNWAAEAARFAPALGVTVYGRGDGEREAQVATAAAGDVLIVSYALLLRDAEAFASRPWATLVLDEAQALKNAATQRVQAAAGVQAGFRLALSGTPVENRLADLWSIMNLVNPGLLGSAARFAERFGNRIERQRDEGARARLRRLVSPFLLRRTKAEVLTDLPPRTEIVQRIEPDAEERAFLEALRRDALARIAMLDPGDAGKNRFNVLAELTRLRRAACDPRLAAPEFGRVGAKLQAFERLAVELVEGRHQALVFSQFTDFLALLAERLDAAGLRYTQLDGSTPAAARGERVAAFQRGDADFFLISLKAGGFGLNLTAADYVVIADPWWNPAAEDQAMGRAHRIGQRRPVTVYRLVTADSVEERIVALHHDKRELADGLLAGQDGGAPLASADLVDLLRDPR